MATFFLELLGGRGTAKDSQGINSQGVSLKSLSITVGQVLAAGCFSDCSMKLLDRYSQNKEGEPDEQLANGMFRAFNSLVTVSFGYLFFTRRCYKWPLL